MYEHNVFMWFIFIFGAKFVVLCWKLIHHLITILKYKEKIKL